MRAGAGAVPAELARQQLPRQPRAGHPASAARPAALLHSSCPAPARPSPAHLLGALRLAVHLLVLLPRLAQLALEARLHALHHRQALLQRPLQLRVALLHGGLGGLDVGSHRGLRLGDALCQRGLQLLRVWCGVVRRGRGWLVVAPWVAGTRQTVAAGASPGRDETQHPPSLPTTPVQPGPQCSPPRHSHSSGGDPPAVWPAASSGPPRAWRSARPPAPAAAAPSPRRRPRPPPRPPRRRRRAASAPASLPPAGRAMQAAGAADGQSVLQTCSVSRFLLLMARPASLLPPAPVPAGSCTGPSRQLPSVRTPTQPVQQRQQSPRSKPQAGCRHAAGKQAPVGQQHCRAP